MKLSSDEFEVPAGLEEFARELADIPAMTQRMQARVFKGIERGYRGQKLIDFALGNTTGWRAKRLAVLVDKHLPQA